MEGHLRDELLKDRNFLSPPPSSFLSIFSCLRALMSKWPCWGGPQIPEDNNPWVTLKRDPSPESLQVRPQPGWHLDGSPWKLSCAQILGPQKLWDDSVVFKANKHWCHLSHSTGNECRSLPRKITYQIIFKQDWKTWTDLQLLNSPK